MRIADREMPDHLSLRGEVRLKNKILNSSMMTLAFSSAKDGIFFLYQDTIESKMQIIWAFMQILFEDGSYSPSLFLNSSVLRTRHAAANNLPPVFLHW